MDQQPSEPMNGSQSSAPKSKAPLAIGAVAGIIVLALIGKMAFKPSATPTPITPTNEGIQNPPSTEPTQQPAKSDQPTASSFKDGQYSADGTYRSPAGTENVHLTLTLKNNVITETQFTASSENPKSQMIMKVFTDNYQTQVIGKNINDVHLTKVSGSSLTPKGFNDALEKIKLEAKNS